MTKLRRVKYLVFVSYYGRTFNGFQKQQYVQADDKPALITVQDVLEEALCKMGFHRSYLATGSRTDKGVNALRHPVIIDVEDPEDKIFTCQTFKKGLNYHLKETEVSCAEVYFVQEKFINKFAVKQKIYDYVIHADLQDDKDSCFIRAANCLAIYQKLPFDKFVQGKE